MPSVPPYSREPGGATAGSAVARRRHCPIGDATRHQGAAIPAPGVVDGSSRLAEAPATTLPERCSSVPMRAVRRLSVPSIGGNTAEEGTAEGAAVLIQW